MDAHNAPTVIRTSTITMVVREFSDGTLDQMIAGVAAVDGEARVVEPWAMAVLLINIQANIRIYEANGV